MYAGDHNSTVVYGPLQPQVFVFDMYEGLMEKPLWTYGGNLSNSLSVEFLFLHMISA